MGKNWSAQQQAIFEWFKNGKGALIVRARAGTGKTTTIIEALNYATEDRCLLAAFNKKIAVELSERISTGRAEAKTLHGLGFAYLRKYLQAKHVQMPQIDNLAEDQRIARVLGVDAENNTEAVTAIKQLVALVKNTAPFATKSEIIKMAEDTVFVDDPSWSTRRVAGVADRVLQIAADGDGVISFDDMIWLPLIHDMVRPWYGLVVIDECQDMNASQILLAQRACKNGGRIVAVGDDRQAIYGFRGADSGSLDRLKKELGAAELPLHTTYRCGKQIVALAQKIVPDYEAATEAPDGKVDGCHDAQIAQLAKPGDFILSRKNAPLMTTCLKLLRAGTPCRIEGRDIGKQLAALVKKMRARTVSEFERNVRAWGEAGLVKAAKRKDPDAASQAVNDQVETLLALAEDAESVDEILKRCASLFEDSFDDEGRINKKPAVICMSVHKSKGLETNRVFVLSYTLLNKSADIEEKNIEYVAVTRAKSHLTWVVEEEKN